MKPQRIPLRLATFSIVMAALFSLHIAYDEINEKPHFVTDEEIQLLNDQIAETPHISSASPESSRVRLRQLRSRLEAMDAQVEAGGIQQVGLRKLALRLKALELQQSTLTATPSPSGRKVTLGDYARSRYSSDDVTLLGFSTDSTSAYLVEEFPVANHGSFRSIAVVYNNTAYNKQNDNICCGFILSDPIRKNQAFKPFSTELKKQIVREWTGVRESAPQSTQIIIQTCRGLLNSGRFVAELRAIVVDSGFDVELMELTETSTVRLATDPRESLFGVRVSSDLEYVKDSLVRAIESGIVSRAIVPTVGPVSNEGPKITIYIAGFPEFLDDGRAVFLR